MRNTLNEQPDAAGHTASALDTERPKILVVSAIGDRRRASLAARYDLTFDREDRIGVRAVLLDGALRLDAAALATFPDLGLIACIGAGFDRVDIDACRARGVKVSNTAGANADAVADFAIGMMLSLTRRIGEGEAALRAGDWRGHNVKRFFSAPGLTGRRVGIVGMGSIGRQLTQRLAGFEVEIAYTGPQPKPNVPYTYVASIRELATWADILVLAHRADETSRGLVDAPVLDALGPDGHLINVSRGSAVNEDALIAALFAGTLGGAALDVFDTEPRVRSDLIAAPNTVLTPHIAGGSRRAFDRMVDRARANLDAHFDGRPLPNPVLA